ncbi:uncharacterized protein LOC129596886 [Paramacrobiotus metropolitanus]|uniref:uncharacterized protein LOC129596886 n=1 Tax=Paramacrobiotus metropolitanus TaxID=2943436 RepID=UPI002445BCD1|nr:uncharacterized protein LOC129596886 [Paramacrobiotus metropolitanus]
MLAVTFWGTASGIKRQLQRNKYFVMAMDLFSGCVDLAGGVVPPGLIERSSSFSESSNNTQEVRKETKKSLSSLSRLAHRSSWFTGTPSNPPRTELRVPFLPTENFVSPKEMEEHYQYATAGPSSVGRSLYNMDAEAEFHEKRNDWTAGDPRDTPLTNRPMIFPLIF